MPTKLGQRIGQGPRPRLTQRLIQNLKVLSLSRRQLLFFLSGSTDGALLDNLNSLPESDLDLLQREFFLDWEGNDSDRKIAHWLFASLTQNGFLPDSLTFIADQLTAPTSAIEAIRQRIQNYQELGLASTCFADFLQFQWSKNGTFPLPKPLRGKTFYEVLRFLKKSLSNQRFTELLQLFSKNRLRATPLRTKSDQLLASPDAILTVHAVDWELTLPNLETSTQDSVLPQSLKEALERRQETLRRVTLALLGHQENFIFQGPLALNALEQKDLAHELGMAPSTLNRALQNKALQTPFGTVPLVTFALSENRLKGWKLHRIWSQELATNQEILLWSDKKIAHFVAQKYGLIFSQRTICKYRHRFFG